MIAYIAPQTSGNAVRILLQPPATATSWRVLRKYVNTFSGIADPDAITVLNGTDKYFIDTTGLANGEVVYYKVYYYTGALFISESAIRSVTPNSIFNFESLDALDIVRDRVDLGLQSMVARGVLTHPRGLIPVMLASPLIEETSLPVVTVHLSSDSAEARGLGELLDTEWLWDERDDMEGWYSRYQIEVIGWSLNSDQRRILRKALKHIIMANLPVFDACGFETIDFQQADNEDFQTYNAPMYTTNCTLRFLAPAAISIPQTHITNVISTLNV